MDAPPLSQRNAGFKVPVVKGLPPTAAAEAAAAGSRSGDLGVASLEPPHEQARRTGMQTKPGVAIDLHKEGRDGEGGANSGGGGGGGGEGREHGSQPMQLPVSSRAAAAFGATLAQQLQLHCCDDPLMKPPAVAVAVPASGQRPSGSRAGIEVEMTAQGCAERPVVTPTLDVTESSQEFEVGKRKHQEEGGLAMDEFQGFGKLRKDAHNQHAEPWLPSRQQEQRFQGLASGSVGEPSREEARQSDGSDRSGAPAATDAQATGSAGRARMGR